MSDEAPTVFMLYVVLRCNRLRRFEQWVTGLGIPDPRPRNAISWWGPWIMDGNVKTDILSSRDLCPVDIEESLETSRCFQALPQHLMDTVVQEYLVGGTRAEKARNLGIEAGTYRRRLNVAHDYLLELFNLAAAGLPLEVEYRGRGRPARDE